MKNVIISKPFLEHDLRNLPTDAKALYLYLCSNADDYGILTAAAVSCSEEEANVHPSSTEMLLNRGMLLAFARPTGETVYAVADWWAMRPYSRASHSTAYANEIARSLCFVSCSRKYYPQTAAETVLQPTGATKCGIVPVYDVPKGDTPREAQGAEQ